MVGIKVKKEEIMKELDISISDEKGDIEYINKLRRTEDKVKYLRIVKRYTQSKTAEIIGISSRHVRRIEKKIKMSC